MTQNHSNEDIQRIAIIGAGGFAREVLDVVDAINNIAPQYDMMGFIVDSEYGEQGTIINDKPIIGDFSWVKQNPDVKLICAVGAPQFRRKLIERADETNVEFCTLIHPNAILTKWVEIGHGSVITAGCVLTNNIKIGHHVHINLDTTIGHDCVIEDFVTISPGVHCSGNVTLQEGSFIGTGANIIEKVNVGSWSAIGAGSTIIKDVPINTTVVGVPGKVVKTRQKGWFLS